MENNDQKPIEETEKNGEQKQGALLAYLHDIAIGIAVVLLIFALAFRGVVVFGPSMNHTLTNGDYLIILNNTFYRNPKYGDIIVASKDTYKDGEPIIKRVIATEGQEVDINFENGIVYVDGVALNEPYTSTPTNLYEGISFPLTVAENCVFVMGDNRNESKDSRSPQIGQIDCREILGRAIFIVLPGKDDATDKRDFSRIGALW